MATPCTANFTPFTNTRILWADVAAVNNFFSGLSFTITAANLPEATVSDVGAVKQLEILEPTIPAIVSATLNIVADDGVTQNEVAMASYVASLEAKVEAMNQWMQALYGQLLAQGYVGS